MSNDSVRSHTIYISVLDARRQDSYLGVFASDRRRLREDMFLTVTADCLAQFHEPGADLVICGEGLDKWQLFSDREEIRLVPLECDARHLVAPAMAMYLRGEFMDVASGIPKYLKPPNITQPA
jgi:hypothetical protein